MQANNNQRMREALLDIHALLGAYVRYEITAESLCLRTKEVVNEALSIPERNCDVGTPNEQEERFNAFCRDNFSNKWHCKGCPANTTGRCTFTWMQMLYEGGGVE